MNGVRQTTKSGVLTVQCARNSNRKQTISYTKPSKAGIHKKTSPGIRFTVVLDGEIISTYEVPDEENTKCNERNITSEITPLKKTIKRSGNINKSFESTLSDSERNSRSVSVVRNLFVYDLEKRSNELNKTLEFLKKIKSEIERKEKEIDHESKLLDQMSETLQTLDICPDTRTIELCDEIVGQ